MKLAFDPESNIVQDATTEIEDTIWIETAHVDQMPHTIHFFLEQVSNGVFDNTQFYWNAPTYVQAGPDHDPHKLQVMEQTQPSLVHLIYQEHSDRLHHQQYTLGYPGRPGGPDFYLNLEDNSGEQGPNNGHTDTDPCFARIIRGFNTMERIHRSRVYEDDGVFRRKQYRIVHPVTIVSMRVQHTDHTYGESPATTPQRR
jgi:cyclophilin family peptidyl-prolyl cis-trans isomerase